MTYKSNAGDKPRRQHTVPAILAATLLLLISCGAGRNKSAESEESAETETAATADLSFSADSAYAYVAKQTSFGPRVPGTEAHRLCGEWLSEKLKETGAEVSDQRATLTTFDGTRIPMRNIFARINPDATERVLLLAHWDSRPWADEDPDETRHSQAVEGANDGASGAGVLLELARVLAQQKTDKGIDILLCDAEDWGTTGDDDSWAMGARHFAQNPPQKDYSPSYAILLDMVGAPDATFMREYFSQQAAPELANRIWATAAGLGYGDLFINRLGSAVTDDHLELIKTGIPAIDIIDYRDGEGFFSGWHTTNDTLDGISAETLGAVGRTLEAFLKR